MYVYIYNYIHIIYSNIVVTDTTHTDTHTHIYIDYNAIIYAYLYDGKAQISGSQASSLNGSLTVPMSLAVPVGAVPGHFPGALHVVSGL